MFGAYQNNKPILGHFWFSCSFTYKNWQWLSLMQRSKNSFAIKTIGIDIIEF